MDQWPMNQQPQPGPGPTPWYASKGLVISLVALLVVTLGALAYILLSGRSGPVSQAPTTPAPLNSGQAQPQTPAVTPPAPAPSQKKATTWNTQDPNAPTNGNMAIALELLMKASAADLEKQAVTASSSAVMKAPWKFYGQVLKITGGVGIAQEYPPGSEISRNFGGGEIGEIVMMTDDGAIIDFLQLGSTGDVNIGDVATVYGYAVGFVEAQNKMGGTTTEVLMVGKLVKKGQ